MLGLGWTEIVFVAFVLLIVVGPERLPKFLRSAGQTYAKLRNAAEEMRRAFVLEADRQDAQDRYDRLQERRNQSEAQREKMESTSGAKAQERNLPPPLLAPTQEQALEANASPTPSDEQAAAAQAASPPPSREDLAALNRPSDVAEAHYDENLPEGVSVEEWVRLPPHVRKLLLARGSDT
jgi:Tat protein translocase TatB subunit